MSVTKANIGMNTLHSLLLLHRYECARLQFQAASDSSDVFALPVGCLGRRVVQAWQRHSMSPISAHGDLLQVYANSIFGADAAFTSAALLAQQHAEAHPDEVCFVLVKLPPSGLHFQIRHLLCTP